MRPPIARALATLAGLGMLAIPGAAHAKVVWTSGFENGTWMPEWSPGVNDTKAAEGGIRNNVVVEQTEVYSGKYACEITVHPDDTFTYNQNRVDIQHQSTLTGEGMDSWISGHYLMLADAGTRNEFAFYESNVSYQNVMDFWVEPKEGGPGTTINFGVGFLGATLVWSADFAIGKWHQVAIHVHWSTNPQLGSIDVWFDGTQVVTAYKAKTKADANTLFYQNGLHRLLPHTVVDTMYIDDFVEADALADAQIAAPTQPGSDGGGGAASGNGDGGATGSSGSAGSGATGASGSSGSTATTGSSGASASGSSTAGVSGSATGSPSGTGAGTGSAAATGTSPVSSGSPSSGSTAASGGGASGAASSGTTGGMPSGTGGPTTSSASGCASSSGRAPGAPFAAAFALLCLGLAGLRRRASS